MKTRVVLVLLASCSASGTSGDRGSLDRLAFEIPGGWSPRELSDQHTRRIEWTPSENTARESVVIMRSSPRAAHARAGVAHVETLLGAAVAGLPQGDWSAPTKITTKRGFHGALVEGSFVPFGLDGRYHRTHAVLIDGDTFVHVIYTAKTPDREHFELVVDTITLEGA